MVLLLIGFHLILPHVLRQSPSKIPLHLSQIFLVVYLKVPPLAHFFSLFIQLLLALSSPRTQSNTTSMLMTPSLLYISFTPSNSTSSLEILSNTFSDILSWMNSNKLLLNPSKTEFLLIGTKQIRLKFSQLTTLSLGNDIIPVSSSARNLGFIFDSDMSFTDQINSLSKSCHFHIRDIRRIRHLLPLSAATALANSLVSSKLDYCNSLYNGISQANLNKIQRIQNTLARVVTNTSKFEHITPILKKLHWLPIKQRIDYKLCLLTYKTLQIQQPTYLYNSLSFPSHSLSTRSSDSSVLSIPYVQTSLGKRAFSVIAPRLWNSFPPDSRNSLSVSTFRSKLKTHLFKLAFPLEFSPILSSDCLPGFDSCFSFTFSPIE